MTAPDHPGLTRLTIPTFAPSVVLNAPEHLTGRMTRGTPWQYRAERQAWIASQVNAGHSFATIGFALGLTRTAACIAHNKPPIRNPRAA